MAMDLPGEGMSMVTVSLTDDEAHALVLFAVALADAMANELNHADVDFAGSCEARRLIASCVGRLLDALLVAEAQ